MKIAFLYAGQGSQKVGMGQDFYEAYPEVRDIFDSAAALGMDIKSLCFEGPAEQLSQTQYTQPCMAAFGAAVTRLLYQRGVRPEYTAGLSLGEYSALHAAGVMEADTLLDLLAYRGKVMQEATEGLASSMVAVLSNDDEAVIKAVGETAALNQGVVACANFNSKGQIVIGGESEAVKLAAEKCISYGAKRCIPLQVSGPFHTPLMEPAAEKLAQKLASVAFKDMEIPLLFNLTGNLLGEGQSVKDMLIEQVKRPVLFANILLKLQELGVDTVVEIGPGKVLSGFVKKTCPEIKTYAVETLEDIETAVEALGGM